MAEKNTNNYTWDYDNYKEWCQYCVHCGSVPPNKHLLCSESPLEGFTEVTYCGHCDKFTTDKKMSLPKYWWLKFCGFEFKNKVVEEIPEEKKRCFYCKHFFCAGYYPPHSRIVCSRFLPQWGWLYFLMPETNATNTCEHFVRNQMFNSKGGR